MNPKKCISILIFLIAIFSIISSLTGLISSKGNLGIFYTSIFNQEVELYGTGIYRNDSISVVAQGLASDLITMIFGIPMLMVSLYLFRKDLFIGKLLLLGTVGYFLYTYISYSFLWFYNPLFLIYVSLMSLSFFSFILILRTIDINSIKSNFKESLPRKFLGRFQISISIFLSFLWISMLLPTIIEGSVPEQIEHYTTFVIQALDLGFIVPLGIISGYLLLNDKDLGYLLSSVLMIKSLTMLLAIDAMIVGMLISGVAVSLIEIIGFSVISLIAFYGFYILIKNIKGEQLHASI